MKTALRTRSDDHAGLTTGRRRLDRAVREVMSAGVVTIAEDASLRQAYRAMLSHDIEAVLVVEAHAATPLGWVTARALLDFLERDPGLYVRQVVSAAAVTIHPGATMREARAALSTPGVTHLLVSRGPQRPPEGVVTALDLLRPLVD